MKTILRSILFASIFLLGITFGTSALIIFVLSFSTWATGGGLDLSVLLTSFGISMFFITLLHYLDSNPLKAKHKK